jgi:protein TonB
VKSMDSFPGRLAGALGFLVVTVAATAAFAGQEKAAPAPLHVGGSVKPPLKIKDSKPIYPEDARRAKVQGVVITEATVGVDGKITAIKVLRPIPMLNDAAVKAVQGQVFKPTLVDGVAVAIVMTVPVIFTLD